MSPATEEADERARDAVWPNETEVERNRITAAKANWFDRWPMDFVNVHTPTQYQSIATRTLGLIVTK